MRTRIKDLREDHDLTQKEISKFLNISQVAYSYYELNKRSIPLELLCKLADFYNSSVIIYCIELMIIYYTPNHILKYLLIN